MGDAEHRPVSGELDDDAFTRLVAPHRARLRAHCYRMLGSLADSDDAVQDTLFRAWRAFDRFEGRSSIGTWLTAIATNVCLRTLEGRRRRWLPTDLDARAALGEPPERPRTDSEWIEPIPTELADLADPAPGPEARYTLTEATELAFVAVVQRLPPQQRAVVLLRHVLGYTAAETAAMLDTTVAATNSALQRATATLERHRQGAPDMSARRPSATVDTAGLASRYARAMQDADVGAVIGLLTADATWSMPPESTWYEGSESIAKFLRDYPFRVRWRHLPANANGQTAVLGYLREDDSSEFRAYALDVLELASDGRIRAVTAFRNSDVLARFALPATLPADFSPQASLAAFT